MDSRIRRVSAALAVGAVLAVTGCSTDDTPGAAGEATDATPGSATGAAGGPPSGTARPAPARSTASGAPRSSPTGSAAATAAVPSPPPPVPPAESGGPGSAQPPETTRSSRTGPTTAEAPKATSATATSATETAPAATAPAATGPAATAPAATSATPRRPRGTLEPVPSVAQTTLAPVPVQSKAAFGGGVTAAVTRTRSFTVTGRGPGEVSGPALAVTVEITNGSRRPVSLDAVTVSAAYGAEEASASTSPPAKPISGTLAPGRKTTGVYVFARAQGRGPVKITVSYSAQRPYVVFVRP